MYLCHKCAGLLLSEAAENVDGLLGCQCISGYYRGFEPRLNREQAIEAQIKQQYQWVALYKSQALRTPEEFEHIQKRIDKLKALVV